VFDVCNFLPNTVLGSDFVNSGSEIDLFLLSLPCGPGVIPPYPVTFPLPNRLIYLLVSFPFFTFLFMLHLSSCFSSLPILPE